MPADVKPKTSAKASQKGSKQSAGDVLSAIDQAVYEKCVSAGGPMTPEKIQSFLPAGKNDVETLGKTLNSLLGRRLLEIMQLNGTLSYRAVAQNEARLMGDMHGDEAMIYGYIKDAGDEGIWSKHLKLRTNLHITVITRTLKLLESKSLVKSVTSVQYPTRRIYMLYDLTPSIEVSGGPWFTDSELDVEFVQSLSNAIERYLKRKSKPENEELESIYPSTHSGFPTLQNIHDFLRGSKVTDVPLGIDDTRALLNVLIYDGKVEKRADGTTYKLVNTLIDSSRNNAYTGIPCGQCPVFNLCQEGGVVSPEGCEYWQEWLSK